MPKLPLNGFLVDVGTVQFVGQNNTPKQNIVLKVPGYVDGFGEKKGQDDFWNISLIGNAVDKFNIHTRHVGAKVKTEVYINSREYTNKEGGTGYIVNVNLASIEYLEATNYATYQQNANAQPKEAVKLADINSAPTPGVDDDLPF